MLKKSSEVASGRARAGWKTYIALALTGRMSLVLPCHGVLELAS
jgi:hypothetical protein